MTKPLRWIAILAVCAAGLMTANRAAYAEDKATKEVRAAAGQFYVALDALFKGNVAPMTEVWSHKDDVTYMWGQVAVSALAGRRC